MLFRARFFKNRTKTAVRQYLIQSAMFKAVCEQQFRCFYDVFFRFFGSFTLTAQIECFAMGDIHTWAFFVNSRLERHLNRERVGILFDADGLLA